VLTILIGPALQVRRRQGLHELPLLLLAVHRQRGVLGLLAQRPRREQHPGLLLRRGVGARRVSLGDHVDQPRHLRLGDAVSAASVISAAPSRMPVP
jgi:hypothetical protein